MNPYHILNVPATADDAAIRRAYLAAVQASPPEREPERFRVISECYAKIKTMEDRWRWMLTLAPAVVSPLEALGEHARHTPQRRALTTEQWHVLLRGCAGEQAVPPAPAGKQAGKAK